MSELRFNLDLIEVSSPCKVPWESMRGSSRVKHCDQCRQNVYQLSELSREEAEALIRAHDGKLCVRFFRRPDGTVLTRDCVAVRWSRAVWKAVGFVAFGFVSIFAAVSLPAAVRQLEKWYQTWQRGTVTTGDLCSPPGLRSQEIEIAPPPRQVSRPNDE